MKSAIKQLLKLSLVVAAAASTYTANDATSSSTIGGVIKKFLTWPIDALSETDPKLKRGPLLSRKLFRSVPISRDVRDASDENVLFSFSLSGSAARKHARNLQEDHGDDHGGVSVTYYDDHSGAAHSDAGHGEAGGHGTTAEDSHDAAHDMVVHVTYEDIYSILLFLLIATGAGIITSRLGMPALVGEIFTGFILGPPLADFVPFPEAMVLVGEIGLIMLLLEAGVELDIAQLKETGTRAVAIGVTGTILPLLVGMGLASATGAPLKSAMAVGASFSPTSLGVAASALKAGKMLDTPVGQLIVASCVIDDILALILLSLFQVLVLENPPIIQYFVPIISSIGFLVILGGSAVTWMPKYIEDKYLHRFDKSNRELAMFTLMAAMMMVYLPLLNYTKASYLTGAFLAGCTFSQVEHAHHQFMEKTHQLMTWLLRVFFAASIGFQVPVSQFSDPYVIGWGFIFYLCVAAKLPLAFYVPQFEDTKEDGYNPFLRDRLITGLSMTCRGEFSFIIAAFALGEGLFNARVYAAIVWAVLLSCVTSPFMLLNMIKYFNQKQAEYLASTNPHKLAKSDGTIPLYLHIKVKSPATMGLQEQFRKILNDLGLTIVERRTNRQGRGLDATVQTDLFVQDTTTTTKVQKIKAQRKIKHALAQAESANQSIHSSMSQAPKKSLYKMDSMKFSSNNLGRLSSNNLSSLDLKSLGDEEQNALREAAAQQDSIIKRGEEVEKAVEDALEDAEVVVDVWNPWPWTDILDNIADHYGLDRRRTADTLETYARIFDLIDTDGGGSIDMGEMYAALHDAGMDITEEGVNTLFGIIDEDGNGDVDRDEWNKTVDFYLELKEEEEEMHRQGDQNNVAEVQKLFREQQLQALQKASMRHGLAAAAAPRATADVPRQVQDIERGVQTPSPPQMSFIPDVPRQVQAGIQMPVAQPPLSFIPEVPDQQMPVMQSPAPAMSSFADVPHQVQDTQRGFQMPVTQPPLTFIPQVPRQQMPVMQPPAPVQMPVTQPPVAPRTSFVEQPTYVEYVARAPSSAYNTDGEEEA